jgi:hypothetical protein
MEVLPSVRRILGEASPQLTRKIPYKWLEMIEVAYKGFPSMIKKAVGHVSGAIGVEEDAHC